MFGPSWAGRLDDVLDAVASAGYEGIDVAAVMVGDYAGRLQALSRALRERNLDLAACSLDVPFSVKGRIIDAIEGALDSTLHLVRVAENPLLILRGPAAADWMDEALVSAAAHFCTEAARRARDLGVEVAVRLTGSGLGPGPKSAEPRLLAAVDAELVKWAPDIGEVVRAGHDAYAMIERHASRIAHVYLRDADHGGAWRPLGQGSVDIVGVIGLLRKMEFDRWIVVDEQSVEAWTAPDRLIVMDMQYAGRAAYG
jgi:sugar phosphate isomerase/epimerase